jgi:hypothetical protein
MVMHDIEVTFPEPCGERWEAMTPSGCNRHCASCDKIIHDLEAYRFDEVAVLLDSDDDICVRARIGVDGAVRLKSGGALAGRLLAAVSATLLGTATPALAQPKGKIVGQVDFFGVRPIVMAEAADGRTYRAKVRPDGRFLIKNLPSGNYVITSRACSEKRVIGNVTVQTGEVVLPRSQDPAEDLCITVGMVQRTSPAG